MGKSAGIGLLDGVGQMLVQGAPEGKHLMPRKQVVVLHADPASLVIAGQIERGLQLEPHDALLVIHGGVAEMTEGLLHAPLAGCRRVGSGLRRERFERGRHLGDQITKLGGQSRRVERCQV